MLPLFCALFVGLFVIAFICISIGIFIAMCMMSPTDKSGRTAPPNRDIWGAAGELPPRWPNKNIWG